MSVDTSVLVEGCVDSVESCVAAERGGGRRLELCDGTFEGGTTPKREMIVACKAAVSIPVFVMIRPRGGDFVYSDDEIASMRRDIVVAREVGADGIVTGALHRDNTVDLDVVRMLVDTAQGSPVTFHRAFDSTPDLEASLESLIDAGVQRVLTSGGAPSAVDGVAALANLVRVAGPRLIVIAGGGVRDNNVREIVSISGVREIHSRVTGSFAKTVAAIA